jgi:hypothetical protein
VWEENGERKGKMVKGNEGETRGEETGDEELL